MEPGTIVEYIDQQRILCAVVLEAYSERVRLLNENNREINQRISRLSHISSYRLDVRQERSKLAEALKSHASKRKALSTVIDIQEIWEALHSYDEWIDLESMTGFCFTGQPTSDHEAAVIRAFFENRTYFKFNFDAFFPHSESVVEGNITRLKTEAHRQRLIDAGGDWLKAVVGNVRPPDSEYLDDVTEILKQYYLFGKDSPEAPVARAILARAGVGDPDAILSAMIKSGRWDRNENIDIYRYGIPTAFSAPVMEKVAEIHALSPQITNGPGRVDLTGLPLITIDGQGTMDYDDALSVEADGKHYRIGVHIADVCEYVEKGGVIDQEVIGRGTSIYMPDRKIPMLPTGLAENICSLVAGQVRPAISVMFRVTRFAEIIDSEIVASRIRVKRQLTYNDVDSMIESDPDLRALHEVAGHFRQRRLDSGALQIQLPEISIRVFNDGDISVKTSNREGPGRVLVSEMMILANWLMARFLAERNMPAIFRSQPDPKGRLYSRDSEGTLFQNWMQRRLLSRAVIGNRAAHHSGLGLDAYTTATSPIRKYFDLATQRQLRACLGLEQPYGAEEIEWILQMLQEPLSHAALVQSRRHRYWLLKHLEGKIGTKAEAIVLDKRRDGYGILIPAYLLEMMISLSGGMVLKPQDLIQITFQHVDAARDKIAVMLG